MSSWSVRDLGTRLLAISGKRVVVQFADQIHLSIAVERGTLVPVPGGVLMRDKSGALVGAVGVSGDTSDNDEVAAIAGIEAAGFTAETGG